jgi:outer membrane protein OmpA-like peptidoglycan-associated protein
MIAESDPRKRPLAVLKPFLAGLCVWVTLGGAAFGLTLDLPASVAGEESRSEVPGSYELPIAGFDGKAVPTRRFEGALEQRAYRLEAPGMTTLAVLAPLRDQLQAAGYALVFECEARGCGGFDFRFGTEVMPEPDMHVDLQDYRFLSAERGTEAVSLLVSRSANAAYVQITRISALAPTATPVKTAVDLDQPEVPQGATTPAAPGASDVTGLAAALDTEGSAVLADLVFDSGSASLTAGDYASLAGVAAWLNANPDGTVALVGHTDASGSLAANIALSERRAEAVAEALVRDFSVDPARLAAKGVGYLAPRATNQTEEGRQKNRRVEVVVTSTR